MAETTRCGRRWRAKAAAVALAAALTLSGCSGGTSEASTGSGSAADVSAATEFLASITGQPSAFPVTTPLVKKLPAGSKIAMLQCSVSFCALGAKILAEAADAMGVELTVTTAGSSATEMQNALESIISTKPTAVIVGGIELSQIAPQLKTLKEDGIPVASFGAVNSEEYGIGAGINGTTSNEHSGALMAAAVVKNQGADANIAYYTTPELGFSAVEEKGFNDELAKLCPDCTVRSVQLPVATYGSTAKDLVVSDLQSHPDTNSIVFPAMEAAEGLPAALKIAGLDDLYSVGVGPTPTNLQDIANGGLTAAIGFGTTEMFWMVMDAVVRLATDEPLADGELDGLPPVQYLEKADITFDPTNGFTAYPDAQERFKKLWAAAS